MFKRFVKLFFKTLTLFVLLAHTDVSPKDHLIISYIGNMGVLINIETKTVLIDGFHEKYKPDYLYPPLSLVNQLINGIYKDFGTIDISLTTHKHKDHFSSAYTDNFLRKNENGIAAMPMQTARLIDSVQYKSIKAVPPNANVFEFTHNNIEIVALESGHTFPQRHSKIENISYIVTIDGFKILHVGDSNWGISEKLLKKHRVDKENLDVAILPYWMLLSKNAQDKMDEFINAKRIIATHLPPNFNDKKILYKLKSHNNVSFFTKIGEEISIK